MSFGRPAMIPPQSEVPLPLDIDDEYLLAEGGGTQPLEVPSKLGMFVYSIRLYDILGDILSTVYTSGVSSPVPSVDIKQRMTQSYIHHMIHLNRKLDDFTESLPRHLMVPKDPTPSGTRPDPGGTFQARVLHCRSVQIELL